MRLVKKVGKVAALQAAVMGDSEIQYDQTLNTHVGIAHTRWATHGPPSDINSHPQRSDDQHQFVVVHNGIITNFKQLKQVLEAKNYHFESETDTEAIAKLAKFIYDTETAAGEPNDFLSIVRMVTKELEGAYALLFKSTLFPNEIIATRRGSPLLVAIKTDEQLSANFIDVDVVPSKLGVFVMFVLFCVAWIVLSVIFVGYLLAE